MMTRYHCPRCTNKVGVGVTLPEPPRCCNFEGHGGSKKYVAMIKQPIAGTTTVEQHLEELL